MKTKNTALRITGTFFGLVAAIHLLRLVTGVSVLIDGWEMPLWFNWIGLVATGFLSGWLWSVSFRISK